MKTVGFDFSRGRLDVSLHPFCGGSSGDLRITPAHDEEDFTSSWMAVLPAVEEGVIRRKPERRSLGFAHLPPQDKREVIVAQIDGLLASGTLAAKGDMLTVPAPVGDLQPAS